MATALAFVLAGCAPSAGFYRSKGFYQGIYYEVPSQDATNLSPTLKKDDQRLYYKNVQTEMIIESNRLTVDGKDYGTLKSGDKVIVTPGGDVYVNGEGRSPVG
jgi:hypothetical protein